LPPHKAPCHLDPPEFYRTADSWIYIACLSQKFWEILCHELEHAELLTDERFTANNERRENRDALTGILNAIFSLQSFSFREEVLKKKLSKTVSTS